MPVSWRHRIVRVPTKDAQSLHETLLTAITDGWIYVARSPGGPGMTDLVFRRADVRRRAAWT